MRSPEARRPWLLLVLLLVSGCAVVGEPLRSNLASESDNVRRCAAWFAALDDAVDRAGVRDAGAHRIPGFPYLRLDRFLASFRDEAAQDDRARAAWIAHLRLLDATARDYELRNLPPEAVAALGVTDRGAALARSVQCADALVRADLASPAVRALLLERARVPDDYDTSKRVLGLYALARLPFYTGVQRWEQQARDAFSEHRGGTVRDVVRYAPVRTSALARDSAAVIAAAPRDALAIPRFGADERAALLEQFAPEFEIETTGNHDRFGALAWTSGPAPRVQLSEPVAYGRLAYTRYGARTLVQLVYTIWFSERPAKSAFDLLSGRLDGVVFRVTLDARGRPLVYDTIHACGCFQMFFPTARVQAIPAPQPRIEWAFVPLVLPAVAPSQRITVRLATRTHYIVDVRGDSGADGAQRYRIVDDDVLRALPQPDGGTRSAFGPDGVVPGTERAERFFFWPMGIDNAGAMRQWGRQATAFVGRRHFDDADLIERRFEIVHDADVSKAEHR
jgi:hypothetical protein